MIISFSHAASTLRHKLSVTVDPGKHTLVATDQITIPADQYKSGMSFLLNSNFTVTSGSPEVTITLDKSGVKAEDLGMDREEFNETSQITQNKYILSIANEIKGDVTFTVIYSGTINYPIKQLGEEYARGFSQTPGIIDEKGVYLAGSTYWVPWFNNKWITFELTASAPEPWNIVSQGKRTLNEIKNGLHIIRWDSPEPMEEIYLIAAQFKEYSLQAGATDVMAYLRTPDETLANKYLETTSQYLEMYRKLVGPYPFTKFALVENFWETGYGMPSFTLLGEQIIRFPFILHSSYPHELLHNYWGNSAYVDFKSGNWCEGLTAYMADHLISEQRGQGDEYRRATLQKFTDYVNATNDFPLKKFLSRTSASSEAIGYGKNLMMWNMLREQVGDEQFVKSFQRFYRDNKFKAASYNDIRLAFESVTGKDLKQFFDQWIERTGAPELSLSKVKAKQDKDGYHLQFSVKQIQKDKAFVLDIPVAVTFGTKTEMKTISMSQREQSYEMIFPENPLMVQIDPQFNLFRKLHYNEIPPSFSKIFGSEELLILLPSKADKERLEYYQELSKIWSGDSSKKIEVKFDNAIKELPAKKSIWIFGTENIYAQKIKDGLKDYDAELTNDNVRFAKTTFEKNNCSFVVSVRHPKNSSAVLVLVSIDSKQAVQGLARKLPHYGKYSYLVFEGSEPTNVAKGEWGSANSPLMAKVGPAKTSSVSMVTDIPRRKALATLDPVFLPERMMKTVNFLASDELAGRAPGSIAMNKAIEFIADKFKSAGLLPGSDDSTYFQTWEEVVNDSGQKAAVKNIIGIIPGTNPNLKDESVIISAHYDHLGLGWPGGNTGNVGKIHNGADDNASGVSVMLELADLLGKTLKPQRTVVFVAFTSEENNLRGSKYYVQNMKRFPAKKVIGVINIDAVGRLGSKKLMVLSASSAREWRFIFMGASYVTGVESEMVTQELDASDQRSFIEVGVPGVQLFAGAHEDYHKPTDVANKIDASGLVKVATFAREGVLYLADRIEPLTSQIPAASDSKKPQTTSGERKVSTGSMPDFAFSGEGVRIAEITPESPAAKAGLLTGDIVKKIGQFKVTNLREYSDALKTFQPGNIVDILFLRDGQEKTTKLELIAK